VKLSQLEASAVLQAAGPMLKVLIQHLDHLCRPTIFEFCLVVHVIPYRTWWQAWVCMHPYLCLITHQESQVPDNGGPPGLDRHCAVSAFALQGVDMPDVLMQRQCSCKCGATCEPQSFTSFGIEQTSTARSASTKHRTPSCSTAALCRRHGTCKN
jgi:hypothetical protein